MTTPADDVEIVDVPAENRFVGRSNGAEAELVYHLHGDRLVLIHTEVPDELAGRGVGGRLVEAAVRRARVGSSDARALVPLRPWLAAEPPRGRRGPRGRLGVATPSFRLTQAGCARRVRVLLQAGVVSKIPGGTA